MKNIEELKQEFNLLIATDSYPKFTILYGEDKEAKNEIIFHIAGKLNATIINIESKIDDIRSMIKTAQTVNGNYIYVIRNGDEMSLSAQNSLLKITEEVPSNCFIIFLSTYEANILDTVNSRGIKFQLKPFSKQDLTEYRDINNITIIHNEDIERIDNITDMKLLQEDYSILEFSKKVAEIIDKVDGSNAFKIASKLSLKKDQEGYNLKLFLKLVLSYWKDMYQKNNLKLYNELVKATYHYMKKVEFNNFNKQFIFDCWILDVRAILLKL